MSRRNGVSSTRNSNKGGKKDKEPSTATPDSAKHSSLPAPWRSPSCKGALPFDNKNAASPENVSTHSVPDDSQDLFENPHDRLVDSLRSGGQLIEDNKGSDSQTDMDTKEVSDNRGTSVTLAPPPSSLPPSVSTPLLVITLMTPSAPRQRILGTPFTQSSKPLKPDF